MRRWIWWIREVADQRLRSKWPRIKEMLMPGDKEKEVREVITTDKIIYSEIKVIPALSPKSVKILYLSINHFPLSQLDS